MCSPSSSPSPSSMGVPPDSPARRMEALPGGQPILFCRIRLLPCSGCRCPGGDVTDCEAGLPLRPERWGLHATSCAYPGRGPFSFGVSNLAMPIPLAMAFIGTVRPMPYAEPIQMDRPAQVPGEGDRYGDGDSDGKVIRLSRRKYECTSDLKSDTIVILKAPKSSRAMWSPGVSVWMPGREEGQQAGLAGPETSLDSFPFRVMVFSYSVNSQSLASGGSLERRNPEEDFPYRGTSGPWGQDRSIRWLRNAGSVHFRHGRAPCGPQCRRAVRRVPHG